MIQTLPSGAWLQAESHPATKHLFHRSNHDSTSLSPAPSPPLQIKTNPRTNPSPKGALWVQTRQSVVYVRDVGMLQRLCQMNVIQPNDSGAKTRQGPFFILSEHPDYAALLFGSPPPLAPPKLSPTQTAPLLHPTASFKPSPNKPPKPPSAPPKPPTAPLKKETSKFKETQSLFATTVALAQQLLAEKSKEPKEPKEPKEQEEPLSGNTMIQESPFIRFTRAKDARASKPSKSSLNSKRSNFSLIKSKGSPPPTPPPIPPQHIPNNEEIEYLASSEWNIASLEQFSIDESIDFEDAEIEIISSREEGLNPLPPTRKNITLQGHSPLFFAAIQQHKALQTTPLAPPTPPPAPSKTSQTLAPIKNPPPLPASTTSPAPSIAPNNNSQSWDSFRQAMKEAAQRRRENQHNTEGSAALTWDLFRSMMGRSRPEGPGEHTWNHFRAHIQKKKHEIVVQENKRSTWDNFRSAMQENNAGNVPEDVWKHFVNSVHKHQHPHKGRKLQRKGGVRWPDRLKVKPAIVGEARIKSMVIRRSEIFRPPTSNIRINLNHASFIKKGKPR